MISKKKCTISAIIAIVIGSASYSELRISKSGLELNGNSEGCVAEPYQCAGDVKTIGVGSTSGKIDNRIHTDNEIAQRWIADLKVAETCVNRYFNGSKLGQNQHEAMTDVVFNIGCYGVRWNSKHNRPTAIYQYAQQENWRMMCWHINDFVNVNGKPNKGIINRRMRNYQHCIEGL